MERVPGILVGFGGRDEGKINEIQMDKSVVPRDPPWPYVSAKRQKIPQDETKSHRDIPLLAGGGYQPKRRGKGKTLGTIGLFQCVRNHLSESLPPAIAWSRTCRPHGCGPYTQEHIRRQCYVQVRRHLAIFSPAHFRSSHRWNYVQQDEVVIQEESRRYRDHDSNIAVVRSR